MGNRIYLTTADATEQTQSLLIFDKRDGNLMKQKVVHQGNLAEKIYHANTHANSTVACDGSRLFTLFNNDQAVWLTCFDLEGEQLWQERVASFAPVKFSFGHGSSPIVVDGLVIIANEYDGEGSCLAAFDTQTGEEKWRTPRQQNISFSTPAIARLKAGNTLLLSGAGHVARYEPSSGDELWVTPATTALTCGTVVWDETLGLAFASGGYPTSQTVAVRLDGDPEIVWKNSTKCYEQSMLVVDGFVYAVADSGVGFCWRGSDGKRMWKRRLGGKYSSSPLLVGDRIYVTNQAGTTFVFRATPAKFELLAENQLGNLGYATPAPSDAKLYHRFARGKGKDRQEFLAAIGE
ncbi:outer membrane protein assembly factor BamB family protein [Adhaeretor mobilis]|uniref:Outer membrane biogenesis protein BamB n=1 Tax=Adhaeretor mobilis TaxID=1930276 RepID=A0A517MUF5_9BACT|nr:outer membrane biogenesis protein BamB [Adhaeretor mobilis]